MDFLLRHAIHAVLTQRRLEAGPLSDFVPWVLVEAFPRDPVRVGVASISCDFSAELSSIAVRSTQECSEEASKQGEACFSRGERAGRAAGEGTLKAPAQNGWRGSAGRGYRHKLDSQSSESEAVVEALVRQVRRARTVLLAMSQKELLSAEDGCCAIGGF